MGQTKKIVRFNSRVIKKAPFPTKLNDQCSELHIHGVLKLIQDADSDKAVKVLDLLLKLKWHSLEGEQVWHTCGLTQNAGKAGD